MKVQRLGVAVIRLDHRYAAFGVLDSIIRHIDDWKLVGVSDRHPWRLEVVRQQWSVPLTTMEFDRLLGRPQGAIGKSFPKPNW